MLTISRLTLRRGNESFTVLAWPCAFIGGLRIEMRALLDRAAPAVIRSKGGPSRAGHDKGQTSEVCSTAGVVSAQKEGVRDDDPLAALAAVALPLESLRG